MEETSKHFKPSCKYNMFDTEMFSTSGVMVKGVYVLENLENYSCYFPMLFEVYLNFYNCFLDSINPCKAHAIILSWSMCYISFFKLLL